MKIDILGGGAFSSALIQLNPGEQFVSDAGAMYRMSANINMQVTTRPRGSTGGFFSALKRLVAGEDFFLSTFETNNGQPGEVGIAPSLPGELRVLPITEGPAWMCVGGSYLGSTPDVQIDTQYQGLSGLISATSVFYLRVAGSSGQLVVNGFGRLVEYNIDGEMTVDNGHVVAFQDSLQYTWGKAGGSWLQSWLAGEGVVLKFTGRGRLVVQSHNRDNFGWALGPELPPTGGSSGGVVGSVLDAAD